jgi:nickel/cobalt transporter (NicO) family protein
MTVTITHPLGVFLFGLVATLAASRIQPETLYPFLGLISGLLVFGLGAIMLNRRIRHSKLHASAHLHEHSHHDHVVEDHRHHHDHHTHSHSQDNNSHDNRAHDHNHDHLHHHHGGHSHSHLPPETSDGKISWRSLLALGISGGLLPCPSAMVLLLTAIALHRIGFGLALVMAFSVGLAIVLTIVGLLFIKGSHLLNRVPSFSMTVRWLPVLSALVACCLGGGITFNAISTLLN